jgi:transcriptional regulator
MRTQGRPPKALDMEVVDKIFALRKQGKSLSRIAQELKLSQGVVSTRIRMAQRLALKADI